jgi:hypothetical protein
MRTQSAAVSMVGYSYKTAIFFSDAVRTHIKHQYTVSWNGVLCSLLLFSCTTSLVSRLIAEVSKSHSDTPHTVGLFWTSDQPVAETYLTKHNTQKRQATMLLAGLEPAIPSSQRQQTHVLDLAVTGICSLHYMSFAIYS